MSERIGGITIGSYNPISSEPVPSTAADGTAIAPGMARYLRSGLFNSDFALRPPSPDSEITDDNPLPYWTLCRIAARSPARCIPR